MTNPLELINLANGGNKEAYQQLLQWLAEHARTQILKNLRQYSNFPSQSLDDIIQDVLITFHHTHQTFDLTKPLLPWINSIIRHKSIDFIRKKEFRVTMTSVDVDTIKDVWTMSDEEELDTEGLIKLIEELPIDQRTVLTLAKIDGFSGKEIATKLGLSESNVKVIIHRAVKQLKTLAVALKNREK
jgi:RNA polymerase sigma-70 factor, ECF subfamily